MQIFFGSFRVWESHASLSSPSLFFQSSVESGILYRQDEKSREFMKLGNSGTSGIGVWEFVVWDFEMGKFQIENFNTCKLEHLGIGIFEN